MNKVFMIGNLTKDPEFATTPSGTALCRFDIAVNRSFKVDGEKVTDFFPVVTWRGLADNCHKYLAKGNKVAIVGELQTRSYEAKDGGKRYVTEIVANDVEFVNTTKKEETTAPKAEQTSFMTPVPDNLDLPF
jgi:single-strand DNA-binding protein